MRLRGWFLSLFAAAAAYAAPVHLRCEFLENPLGIDVATPHLSWQSDSQARNWRQSAYQILVAGAAAGIRAGKGDIWDSGKQSSPDSIDIAYGGPKLESGKRYYWTVRVWDAAGKTTQAAVPAWWEMGLLAKTDWTASWISWKSDEAEDRVGVRLMQVAGQAAPAAGTPRPASIFRTTVEIKEKPIAAALFVSAGGAFRVALNGKEIYSKRSWASFDRQDIADRIAAGGSTVEITVPAPAGQGGGRGQEPAGVAALLKVAYADGTVER